MLQFEAAGGQYSEYWFMMPNVIRRVLDVFLAFKVPGSHPLQQKLEAMTKKCPDIDDVRIKALDRLIQVESHSDSLDDLVSHSSMTIEETRDANAALLELMAASDATIPRRSANNARPHETCPRTEESSVNKPFARAFEAKTAPVERLTTGALETETGVGLRGIERQLRADSSWRPFGSDFNSLCDGRRIFELDAEIAHCAIHLRMACSATRNALQNDIDDVEWH